MTSTTVNFLALILMLIDHIGEFIPGTPIWLRWIGIITGLPHKLKIFSS